MAADDVDLNADLGDVVTSVNPKPTRYEMRAKNTGTPNRLLWQHTAPDYVGTYSGVPIVQLSLIKLVRVVPAGEP